MRALALALALAAAPSGADVSLGSTRFADVYLGATRICDVYAGTARVHTVGTPPTIARFAASRATYRAGELPANVTLTFSVSGSTHNAVARVRGGTETNIPLTSNTTAVTPVPATCGSAGCEYVLHAEDRSATGCSRDATARARVRVVTPPTLTAFSAGRPYSLQGPGVFSECVDLAWTSTAGDPPATWAMGYTGTNPFSGARPDNRRLAPDVGSHRVCYPARLSGSTAFVLTGTNEAGAVSRSVTVRW